MNQQWSLKETKLPPKTFIPSLSQCSSSLHSDYNQSLTKMRPTFEYDSEETLSPPTFESSPSDQTSTAGTSQSFSESSTENSNELNNNLVQLLAAVNDAREELNREEENSDEQIPTERNAIDDTQESSDSGSREPIPKLKIKIIRKGDAEIEKDAKGTKRYKLNDYRVSKSPEAPKKRGRKPKAAAKKRESAKNIPSTIENVPSTIANIPSTISNVPSTSADVPNTSADVPNTASIPTIIQNYWLHKAWQKSQRTAQNVQNTAANSILRRPRGRPPSMPQSQTHRPEMWMTRGRSPPPYRVETAVNPGPSHIDQSALDISLQDPEETTQTEKSGTNNESQMNESSQQGPVLNNEALTNLTALLEMSRTFIFRAIFFLEMTLRTLQRPRTEPLTRYPIKKAILQYPSGCGQHQTFQGLCSAAQQRKSATQQTNGVQLDQQQRPQRRPEVNTVINHPYPISSTGVQSAHGLRMSQNWALPPREPTQQSNQQVQQQSFLPQQPSIQQQMNGQLNLHTSQPLVMQRRMQLPQHTSLLQGCPPGQSSMLPVQQPNLQMIQQQRQLNMQPSQPLAQQASLLQLPQNTILQQGHQSQQSSKPPVQQPRVQMTQQQSLLYHQPSQLLAQQTSVLQQSCMPPVRQPSLQRTMQPNQEIGHQQSQLNLQPSEQEQRPRLLQQAYQPRQSGVPPSQQLHFQQPSQQIAQQQRLQENRRLLQMPPQRSLQWLHQPSQQMAHAGSQPPILQQFPRQQSQTAQLPQQPMAQKPSQQQPLVQMPQQTSSQWLHQSRQQVAPQPFLLLAQQPSIQHAPQPQQSNLGPFQQPVQHQDLPSQSHQSQLTQLSFLQLQQTNRHQMAPQPNLKAHQSSQQPQQTSAGSIPAEGHPTGQEFFQLSDERILLNHTEPSYQIEEDDAARAMIPVDRPMLLQPVLPLREPYMPIVEPVSPAEEEKQADNDGHQSPQPSSSQVPQPIIVLQNNRPFHNAFRSWLSYFDNSFRQRRLPQRHYNQPRANNQRLPQSEPNMRQLHPFGPRPPYQGSSQQHRHRRPNSGYKNHNNQFQDRRY